MSENSSHTQPDPIIRRWILQVDRKPKLRQAYEPRVLQRAIDFMTPRKAFMGV